MFCLSLTPLVEPFTDTNGNDVYDYSEPFEDLNGNGEFDPVWMGGFAPGRLAHGVRDSLWARTLVLESAEQRLVIVVLDVIGFNGNRVRGAKAALAEEYGIHRDEVIIASTHTHSGPDTMGMWGP